MREQIRADFITSGADPRGDRPSREHYVSRPNWHTFASSSSNIFGWQSSRRDRDDRRDGDRDRHRERRRSRSPRSRRDYEVDTYSSSRDYREREREERYGGGRERRDDRGWDRDRGRRDDDRPPRRDRGDRDLFADRGDRGGRGGRDRGNDDAFSNRRDPRNKSKSPPPKKKEPTPDLTDTIPVLERKRRLTQWDIKPPGYENVTAEQAKLSGMFPLPGAPRQQPMDPSRLQAFVNQSSSGVASSSLKPSQARQSKRLFVYNLPSGSSDASIADFFNLQLNGLNVISSADPCISAQIAREAGYALVEFKTPEDATVALALDGISMSDDAMDTSNGVSNGDASGLSIRRPKDYIAPALTDEEEYPEGTLSSIVKDTANKIAITNIPVYLTDEQVTELLAAFGTLKAFTLVVDRGTQQSRVSTPGSSPATLVSDTISKGIAFCEYADPSATDVAVEGLNGMELGEAHLKAKRASIGTTQASGLEMGVNAMSMLASTAAASEEPQSRVLQLLNMVTAEELLDGDEYEEIMEDVKEECSKFGAVLELKIPRPSGAGRTGAGVGKIFVKYSDPASAQAALKALAGRKFADRTVVVTFFGEVSSPFHFVVS